MKKVLVKSCLGATVSVFALTSSFIEVKAQTGGVDEIVVVSRKVSENLQDVPIAVTAFSATDIEDAGIERPEDFIGLTPNVVMVNTANAGDSQVTIRGITSTRDAESNFGLVVDGVLLTNPNAFNRELLDIEQIEVLKGPQGALYGRNASSGAILISTKKPDGEGGSKVSLGYGSNNSYKVQGITNLKLADNITGRISASTSSTDGFETNRYTGQDDAIDYFEDTTLRGRFIIDTADASWDVRGGFSEVSGGAINFNATFALPGFANAFANSAYHADVNAHNFQYFPNIKPENEQETLDFSVKYETDLSSGNTLTATLAYNNLEEWLISDGTAASFGIYAATVASCAADLTDPTIAGLINGYPGSYTFGTPATSLLGPYTASTCDGYQYQERNQEDLSLEVRLQGETNDVDWIIGGYMATIDREVAVSYGADLGTRPKEQAYVAGVTDLLFWDDFSTDVYSIFGQANYDLSDATELAIEARFDREERSVSNKVPKVGKSYMDSNADGVADTTLSINPGRATITADIPNRDATYDQLQPKVTLGHDLSEATRVYGSYGYGFRSGGFNSLGSQTLIQSSFNDIIGTSLNVTDEYEKEVSQALEFGFKGRYLENRLQLNGAIFQTKVEDNQFFEFFAGTFGLMRVVTTIDELELQGAELDFKYAATDTIRIDGGFGLTDGEIKENKHRPYTVGNDAPLTPKYTVNLGVQYTNQIGALESILRVDYARIGETDFHTVQDNQPVTIFEAAFATLGTANFNKTARDAYDTVDVRFTLNSETWSASIFGRNILDEEYLSEIINAPEFGGSFIHEAQGANFGATVSLNF